MSEVLASAVAGSQAVPLVILSYESRRGLLFGLRLGPGREAGEVGKPWA